MSTNNSTNNNNNSNFRRYLHRRNILDLLRQTVVYDSKDENDATSRLKTFNKICNDDENNNNNIAICIAEVASYIWSLEMIAWAEEVIHELALQNNYIQPQDFITSPYRASDYYRSKNGRGVLARNAIGYLIWEDFKMKEHYAYLYRHRAMTREIYGLVKHLLPVPHELHKRKDFYADMDKFIDRHNLSQCQFLIALGYTLKFVHGIEESRVWSRMHFHETIAERHYKNFWSPRNMPDIYLYQNFISMLAHELSRKPHESSLLLSSPQQQQQGGGGRSREEVMLKPNWFSQFNKHEKKILQNLIDTINENSEVIEIGGFNTS